MVSYIKDLEGYKRTQKEIKIARSEGNEDEYFRLLDIVPKTKDTFKYNSPIFITDKLNVAKTYADSRRSTDYQNAIEKVIKVKCEEGSKITIDGYGQRFRFIKIDSVKKGFKDAGIDETKFENLLEMFNYYVSNKEGIKTDVIGVMGYYLGFDMIDISNVLDSYEGGSVKSTVRMVFNRNKLTII